MTKTKTEGGTTLVARLHKISKALGAAAPGLGLLVSDFALEVSGVTEDGVLSVSDWYLLAAALIPALGAYLAPKNAA